MLYQSRFILYMKEVNVMKKMLFAIGACFMSLVIAAPGELNRLANRFHTDKADWGHNYVEWYEKYFEPMRDKNIKILEIGFDRGGSARLWEAYFPHAEIHFIDYDRDCLARTQGLYRTKLHLVDIANQGQLEAFLRHAGGNFDVIIDDGSHIVHEQLTAFKLLFPHLKSSGIYVIEDLFGSYWKFKGGGGTQENPQRSAECTVSFLCSLIDDVNFIAARNIWASFDKFPSNIPLTYYQRNVKSLHFYGNICFIFKR